MRARIHDACRRGLFAVALAGLVVGCDGSRSEPTRVTAGGLRLDAALEPAAGRVGENHLWITLEDAEGRPLTDAELGVKVHMVAMGAMPAMGGVASVEPLGAGRFRADFELEMAGTWRVEVEARAPDAPPRRVEGSLTVGTPGVRLRAEGQGAAGHSAGHAQSGERHPAEFSFEPARLQKIGVRTVRVERGSIGEGVRAVGRVVYDETRLQDVSPRVSGWIEEIHADAVGQRVERGEVLFSVYSPDLLAAQQELLQALRSEGALAEAMVRAARKRLRLWGVATADVDRIVRRGRALEALPVRSPASGTVIEKNVVAGSAIEAGQRLMRIAPLDHVWLEVDIYEADLPRVHVGQEVDVTLSHQAGEILTGTVSFVYPYLQGDTRTARARIELENPDGLLRPEMFANVDFHSASREALVVPEGAVLHAGDRQFVFLALGEGRFRPQSVEIGLRQGGRIEIRSGLEAGQEVVSSGTFLIASESRLRAALEQW